MSKSDEQASCELCGRSGVQTTVHHLTPREKGGSSLPTAKLCSACHRQIHALYTNDDLITLELTSLAALRSDPSIAPFLKWVRKQPPQSRPKLSKSRRVRSR
ncbi:HNH endonuclease [Paenibacillus pinihumi]|uniref:HNH endonuclease n=1 Tax=Paenibacillus pinihumi TaxID=669462 RepID=UPI000415EEEA|nr:HNH endonuclease [Paenibacillus pinihumi]